MSYQIIAPMLVVVYHIPSLSCLHVVVYQHREEIENLCLVR